LIVALSSVTVITATYLEWLHVTNATTVALSYLLVVLFVAASSRLRVAVTTSLVAMLCFNFYQRLNISRNTKNSSTGTTSAMTTILATRQ
jgi:K+-sensing histidine kinase KdpD